MSDSLSSQSVKAGSITYFFDVKETRQGKPYLMITMSRFKGEGEDWDRVSIPLFPENIKKFIKTFLEMAQNIPNISQYENDDNQGPSNSQLPLRGVRSQRPRSSSPMGRRKY